ncbi:sulfotransferase family 2 domain-containing protein [Acidobacteriota bacterium]
METFETKKNPELFCGQYRKFWFVKVGKTANTAVKKTLAKYISNEQGINVPGWHQSTHAQYGRLDPHSTAQEIISKFSYEEFMKIYSFGFARNPWDRAVSCFFMLKQRHRVKEFKSLRFDEWLRITYKNCQYLAANNLYPEGPRPDESFQSPGHADFSWYGPWTKSCYDYFIYDSKIVVDFIGKFENLQEDFNTICRKIGIQDPPKLKRYQKTRHKHYTKYYPTQELKDMVEFIYKNDVEHFGYKFEE